MLNVTIQLTPSNNISAVLCAFSQEKDDWRRSAIFHTFIKIGDKNWKVIIDSESCVNAISLKMIENIGWEAKTHPHPYKVLWINSLALNVK